MDRGASKPRPRALRPHRKLQMHPSRRVGPPRHPRPHNTRLSHRAASPHRAIRPRIPNGPTGHVLYTPNLPTALRLRSHPTVDVDVHSSERVMSPASRRNRPMFKKENRKCRACLEDLPWFVCPGVCLLGRVGKSRYRRGRPDDKIESLIGGSDVWLSLVFVVVCILDLCFLFRIIY